MLVHGLNEQSLNMNSRSLKLKTLTLLLMRKCFICYTYEKACNKTENWFKIIDPSKEKNSERYKH
jgi:hypothetical protein